MTENRENEWPQSETCGMCAFTFVSFWSLIGSNRTKNAYFKPRIKPKAFRASSKNTICTFPLQLFGTVCPTSANNMCAQRASWVVLGLQETSPSPGLSIWTCQYDLWRSMHFEWGTVRDEKGRPESLRMIESGHRSGDSIWCNEKTTSCAAAETRSEASRDPTIRYN